MNQKTKFLASVMIVFAFGYILGSPTITMATPFEASVTTTNNTAGVYIESFSSAPVGVYTEYTLISDFGSFDAFCIEAVPDPSGKVPYELVSLANYKLVDSSKLGRAAWVADQYWSGNAWNIAKESYQIAIWEIVFDDGQDLGSGSFRAISGYSASEVKWILDESYGQSSFDGFVAHSPVSSYTDAGYQDYLVNAPVPEPATMLLLGTGLIGLAGFGRKKLFKK